MASKLTNVVELIYLTKDLASASVEKIVSALRGVPPATEDAAAGNKQLEESFEEAEEKSNRFSEALRKTRNSIAGYAAAIFGLNSLRKGFLSVLDAGADLEKLEIQIKQLYDTAEEGGAAFAWVRQFAKENPTFDVTQAFVKLKAFGIEPATGSLQALIDQSAKLGGNQQTLEGLILAVGQAWSKQKLQGEEILQLVERGVPVWDLLAKATGKNVQELQKLSSQGKLGRAEIKLLLDEIGRSSEGSAKAQLGTFSGLISSLQTQYKRFLEIIANSGVLDTVKRQLEEFNNNIEQMAKSGQLDRLAKGIGAVITGIINFVRSMGGTGVVLLQVVVALKAVTLAFGGLFRAIGLILQVGLILRIAGWVKALKDYTVVAGAANAATSGMSTAAGIASASVSRFTGLIFSLGNAFKGTLVVAAVASVVEIIKFGKSLYDAAAAAVNLRDTVQDIEGNNGLLAEKAAEAKKTLADYADQAVLTGNQLRDLSEEEIKGYQRRLEAARDYFLAVRVEGQALGDEPGVAAATDKIKTYEQALQGASDRLKQLQSDAAAAAAAQAQALADLDKNLRALGLSLSEVQTGISDSEQKVIDALTEITKSTELTGDILGKAFTEAFEKVESPKAIEQLKSLLDRLKSDAVIVKGETEGLRQAEEAYNRALEARANTTKTAVDAQKDNAAALEELAKKYQDARNETALLEQSQQLGNATAEQVIDARRREAEALQAYNDALAEGVDAAERSLAARERETNAASRAIDVKIADAQAAERSAQAAGDEVGARNARVRVLQLEAQQARVLAEGRRQEAAAADALIKKLREQAEVDGIVTAAEAEAIARAQESADAKREQAQISESNARSKLAEARAAKETTTALNKEAEAVEKLSQEQKAAQKAAADLGAAQEFLSQIIEAQEKRLAGVSEAAKQAFQDRLTNGAITAANAIETTNEKLEIANDRLLNSLRIERSAASGAFTQIAAYYGRIASEIEVTALRQQGALERLLESAENGSVAALRSLTALTGDTDRLRNRFDLLDQSTLDHVVGEVQRLNGEIAQSADKVASLRERLAQLQGDEAEVQRLRNQRELLEIERELAEARANGTADEIKNLEEALRLQKQINEEELRRIEERNKEKGRQRDSEPDRDTERPAGGSGNLPDRRNVVPIIPPESIREPLQGVSDDLGRKLDGFVDNLDRRDRIERDERRRDREEQRATRRGNSLDTRPIVVPISETEVKRAAFSGSFYTKHIEPAAKRAARLSL